MALALTNAGQDGRRDRMHLQGMQGGERGIGEEGVEGLTVAPFDQNERLTRFGLAQLRRV